MFPATFTLPRILVSIIAMLGIALFVQQMRVSHAQAKLEDCKTAYAVAMVSVDAQNKAIKELQAKSEAAEARVTDANKRAQRIISKARDTALAYGTAQIPMDCTGALNWQAEQGRAIGSKWGGK